MKKAQAYEIFVYVLSALIVGLVLYYGYRAVAGFGDKEKELQFIKFRTNFENTINSIAPDFGTVRVTPIDVPSRFEQICIVDPQLIGISPDNPNFPSNLNEGNYPLIYDSVTSGAEKNIFPLPDGEPFYVKKIQLEEGFKCFEVAQSQIRVRLEGLGDRAKISSS